MCAAAELVEVPAAASELLLPHRCAGDDIDAPIPYQLGPRGRERLATGETVPVTARCRRCEARVFLSLVDRSARAAPRGPGGPRAPARAPAAPAPRRAPPPPPRARPRPPARGAPRLPPRLRRAVAVAWGGRVVLGGEGDADPSAPALFTSPLSAP